MRARDVLDSFLLLPGNCIACGAAAGRRADLCAACEADLPWLHSACRHCALPAPPGTGACGRCLRRPPPQRQAVAAFLYGFPINSLVQRFKFHGDRVAGRVLAERLATALENRDGSPVLVPVPLSRVRERDRGFNQAALIANDLAARLGLAVDESLVARVRHTEEQSGKSAAERRRNLRGAFALMGTAVPAHVAIVDDVMTTGSTIHEIARLLLAGGVKRVDAWVVARTP